MKNSHWLRWSSIACCLLIPTLLRAEEVTMAWHFAVPQLDGFRATSASASEKVIADPPAPTVFAAKGDRLIDLSAELRKMVNGGDETWLIWNETRHQLVARGKATTLAYVEEISRFQAQPQMIDIAINWYEGITPGDAIPDGKVPDATLSTMARTGQEVVGDWIPSKPASLSRLQFKITAVRNEEGTVADLQYSIGWREPSSDGPLDWNLGGSAPVKATKGTPLILGQAVSPTGKRGPSPPRPRVSSSMALRWPIFWRPRRMGRASRFCGSRWDRRMHIYVPK